jgi:4-hydroxybenzoate polyprenyltransferase
MFIVFKVAFVKHVYYALQMTALSGESYIFTSEHSRMFDPSPNVVQQLQAYWELCHLHNNMGFWVVWLPTGTYPIHAGGSMGLKSQSLVHHNVISREPGNILDPGSPTSIGICSALLWNQISGSISIADLFNNVLRARMAQIMTIDDLLDHDHIDALVERTKYRPIPRGAISVKRAWMFFSLQVLVGFYCARAWLSPLA